MDCKYSTLNIFYKVMDIRDRHNFFDNYSTKSLENYRDRNSIDLNDEGKREKFEAWELGFQQAVKRELLST